METPEIGDRVRVRSTAGCDEEGTCHGYHPYIKGLVGTIVPPFAHVNPPPSHPWVVDFGFDLSHGVIKFGPKLDTFPTKAYFAASELELVKGATP